MSCTEIFTGVVSQSREAITVSAGAAWETNFPVISTTLSYIQIKEKYGYTVDGIVAPEVS